MPLPQIRTVEPSRLSLAPLREIHLDELMEVYGDDLVTRFVPYETWKSRKDGEAWLTKMTALSSAGTASQLVLQHKRDSRVIGTLLLFKYEEGSRRLEIGYALGRRYWRKGLMREAVSAACAYAFSALGVRRIEAEVNPANTASCGLLTRIGFVLEGTLRQRWTVKGSTYDTRIYGLLVDEWSQNLSTLRAS